MTREPASEPTAEQIAYILKDAPDIGPEVIRRAAESVDELVGLAQSWIINGKGERYGQMLQTLALGFGYQQTEIERLRSERHRQKQRGQCSACHGSRSHQPGCPLDARND